MGNKKNVENKKYKDTLFRMLFKEKKELLSLFNAVTGSDYDNPDNLQITTLENAVYVSMKNDVSCIIDLQLHLYEHQSTVNPNMPLRCFLYVAIVYDKLLKNENIFSKTRILLPTPTFIVFYNGADNQPERRVMKLSDSFAVDTGETNLELMVVQLNINPGYNEQLKRDCPTLMEYMLYVDRVRTYRKEMPLDEAVDRAIRECIKEGILADFLRENMMEARRMSVLFENTLFGYNDEKYMRMLAEEEREEERAEGRAEGIAHERYQTVSSMLQRGKTPEEISEFCEYDLSYVKQVAESMTERV